MEEWKEYKLGEVCTITRGASPRPIQNFLSDKGMPWVKIADATASDSRYINSTSQCIVSSGVDKSKKVYVGDLIVSNSATPGLPKFMAIDACVHDGWLIIRDVRLTTKEYLYYSFIDIRRELTNQANGSVFMNLKTDIVRNFTINLPPLEKQNKIVGILSSLDDKIEVNRRINEQLEELAQALFKSWFVDFEPFKDGDFVESELGMIPKGWKVGKAEEFYKITIGKTPPRKEQEWFTKSSEEVKWVSISDMGNCGTFIADSSEYLTNDAILKFNIGVVSENTILLSFKLTIGRVAIAMCDLTTNEAIARFSLIDETLREYTYLMLKQYNYANLGSTSSIATAVNSKIIKQMRILMPKDEVILEFSKLMKPVFENIRKNQQEITHLTTLRDTLLPKLMSGEIDVNDVAL